MFVYIGLGGAYHVCLYCTQTQHLTFHNVTCLVNHSIEKVNKIAIFSPD